MEQPAQQTVAIVVEDVSSRRLLETICKGLDLTPPTPTEDELTAEHSFDCEIIVVDRSLATKIRPRIGEQQKQREQVRPALIAVTAGSEGPSAKDAEDGSFDAVLAFPYNVEVQTWYRSEQHIVCLASEIRQVLTSLVTNAVHAMQATGGRLLIRTHEATDWRSDQWGVTITVADTGKGMSQSTQTSIDNHSSRPRAHRVRGSTSGLVQRSSSGTTGVCECVARKRRSSMERCSSCSCPSKPLRDDPPMRDSGFDLS